MLSRATVQQSAKTFKFRIGYAKTLLDLTSTPTKIIEVMIRSTHEDFDLLTPKELSAQTSKVHRVWLTDYHGVTQKSLTTWFTLVMG